MRIQLVAILVGALGTISCDKGKPDETATTQSVAPPPSLAPKAIETAPPSASASVSAAPGAKAAVEFHIASSGATMVFDVKTFTVTAGQPIHLVLENKKPGALAHNWALVRPGTEASVAAAGLDKGADAGFVAEGPDLLQHTEMVLPGASTEITFNAPKEPGKYPYICTYPGHYMMMKGVLEVTP